MLTLVVEGAEYFNESTSEFVTPDAVELSLEHSLVSLSKWESIHEKPFISKDEKTTDEVISYITCMILTPSFPRGIVERMSEANFKEIYAYIESKQTATFINQQSSGSNREPVTSELIYYWMITLGVPFEAQHWHLNKLLMLIRVCSLKNEPKKKVAPTTAAAAQRELNAQRRAQLGTSG